MNSSVATGAGLVLLGMFVLLPEGRGAAAEREIGTYQVALERICVTGVTPEVARAYEQAVLAQAREAKVSEYTALHQFSGQPIRYQQATRGAQSTPHGTTLSAVKFPEDAQAECVQSP